MKHFYIIISFLYITLSSAQTEWTGPMITISKNNFEDWTLEENQDRITPNVWLTRANSRGLFNIVLETEYDRDTFLSPLDTEWAVGSISDGVSNLFFDTYDNTLGGMSPTLNQNFVLHLITDDIYIDFVFLQWTQGDGFGNSGGGGFIFERSTENNLNTGNFTLKNNIKIGPNPASDHLNISGTKQTYNFSIFNVLGQKVSSGLTINSKIDISEFKSGIYILKIDNNVRIKFLKK